MYQQFINLLFSKTKTMNSTPPTSKANRNSHNKEKSFISFLKKSTTSLKVNNNIFRVQNLLNEVYGLIEPIVQKNKIEFLYDIDESIPIELVGDTLILEQMLYNLLYAIIEDTYNTTVILQLKKENNKLLFHIRNQHFKTEEKMHLNTYFLDSVKLLKKIEGELSLSRQGLDTIHEITLELLSHDLYQETYSKLPSYIHSKKILLIEDHPDTRRIFYKIFAQFNLNITIENSDKLPNINNLETYHMLILDAKVITPILMRHLQGIKESSGLKIISLETLYGWHQNRRLRPNALVNKYLYRPLSRGMVSGLLHEIFVLRTDKALISEKYSKEKSLQRTGEIVFVEETLNINRQDFRDFGNKHILVVEDNLINQKIMQSILEKSNIKITITNNGQEALDFLNNNTYIDLVIMDINMPKMDGYQATKHIRKNDTLKDLPIIIISGLGFRNDIEQMYLVGADAHLTKPFKIGELYTIFKMFSTKQQKTLNILQSPPVVYKEDKELLDTIKGISKMHNILVYRDKLREILVRLKFSNIIIKEHIIRKDYKELKNYCTQILLDCKSIEAKSLSQILDEMLILANNHEEDLLQQYISQYHNKWIKSKIHIELYLKSVDAY